MELNFVEMVKLSLDKDLCDLLDSKRVHVSEVMALQMLRLQRGKAFVITSAGTSVEGWTPDGVKWYPSEPGTFTTGGETK